MQNPLESRLAELQLSRAAAGRMGATSGYGGHQALCWALGLDPDSMSPLRPRDWLGMAAQSSSVSYRTVLPAPDLARILSTGEVPAEYLGHIRHLFDEVPVQVVVQAAEAAANQAGVAMAQIWRNVERAADSAGAARADLWNQAGAP